MQQLLNASLVSHLVTSKKTMFALVPDNTLPNFPKPIEELGHFPFNQKFWFAF